MITISLRLTEWQRSPDPGSPTVGVTLGNDPNLKNLTCLSFRKWYLGRCWSLGAGYQ